MFTLFFFYLSYVTGFADISPEELRLECNTARESGNMQNYVNVLILEDYG